LSAAVLFTSSLLGQGIITTIAGNGGLIAGPDGGQATATAIGLPLGVAVDSSGNVYFADTLAFQISADFPDGEYPITGTIGGIAVSTGTNISVKR
jgi:hypothetical protein